MTRPIPAPAVNITMVAFNRAAFTRRSIESLALTAGMPFLLTVVDNCSTDGTQELLREMEARGTINRLILNPVNRGVAFAANQGWAASSSRFYLKLDNDIVMTRPGWLEDMAAVAEKIPDLGALAYNFETVSYPAAERHGVRLRVKQGSLGGCCILIPAAAHEKLGFWCEDYFPYGEEDADFHYRCGLAGLSCYYMEDEDAGLHLPEGKASPLAGPEGRSVFSEEDPAYRADKDRWRALYTRPEGLRSINERLYRRGLRPLYIGHGEPFRPGWRAKLLLLRKYGTTDPWKKRAVQPGKGKPE